MPDFNLLEGLRCNIGRTVTIFTESGGLSGAGFTGVLASVSDCVVKLITGIGAAPACAVGSCCTEGCGNGLGFGLGYGGYGYGGYGYGGYGYGGGYGGGYGSFSCGCSGNCNWLGSVTEIPVCKIVSFVHNAI